MTDSLSNYCKRVFVIVYLVNFRLLLIYIYFYNNKIHIYFIFTYIYCVVFIYTYFSNFKCCPKVSVVWQDKWNVVLRPSVCHIPPNLPDITCCVPVLDAALYRNYIIRKISCSSSFVLIFLFQSILVNTLHSLLCTKGILSCQSGEGELLTLLSADRRYNKCVYNQIVYYS